MRVLPLTDASGRITDPAWLARAEPVHRQLRPQLPVDYPGRIAQVCANGAQLVLVVAAERVLGLAVWRVIENTYEGRRLFVDDLVVDEQQRSTGVGHLLLGWLERQARELGCAVMALESGVQRSGAHKFYFREGMTIASYSFRKALQ